MKVAVISRVLWPSGVPRIAIEQVKGLTRRGYQCHLIIGRESSYEYRYEDLLKGVYIVTLLRCKIARLLELLNYVILFPLMPRYRSTESTIDFQVFPVLLLRLRSNYDLLICHDQITCIIGFLAKKLFKIPFIAYLYEPLELPRFSCIQRIVKTLERRILKEADAVVASSLQMYKLLRDFKVNRRTLWIQQGCYLYKSIKPIEDRDDIVLTVARWDEGRKPLLILDVAERVPNAKFIVAGSWTPKSLEDKFINEVKRRGLKGRVAVMPDISEDELHRLYMEAKVVMRWGIKERGTGTAILEGISHGCSIVTNGGLGGSLLLGHGMHGYIADKLNATQFANYIRCILTDEKLAKKMSLNCHRLSLLYSWNSHIDKLEGLIYEVMSYVAQEKT